MPIESTELSRFVQTRETYYANAFYKIQQGPIATTFNMGAFLAGPLWAAARGIWWLFWAALVLDAVGIAVGVRTFVLEEAGTGWFAAGAGIFVLGRVAVAALANRALFRKFERWRLSKIAWTGLSPRRVGLAVLAALAVVPLVIYRTLRVAPTERDCRGVWSGLQEGTRELSSLKTFDCMTISAVPIDRSYPQAIAVSIDESVNFLTVNYAAFFDSIGWFVRTVLVGLENLFIGIPWLVMGILLTLISWRLAGTKVSLFTIFALAYLALMGFWQNAMATISLVFAAVTIAIIIGIPLGILAAKNRRANAVIQPVLDVMQTLPSFVYLIPAIAFFSIGKTPAVMATVIYSVPALIRLTALGIRQVPATITEAALAFGATPLQLLTKVELPLARPTVMTGVNQAIMMSLAMSVITALIGAGGLGFDVLVSLQQVQPGKGLLAGIAIAFCAMIIDRSVQGMRQTRS